MSLPDGEVQPVPRRLVKNRRGGSVVFAIVMVAIAIPVVSLLWYCFAPVQAAVASLVEGMGMSSGALSFSQLLTSIWAWLGVIMLLVLLVWSFFYTQKEN